MLVKKHLNLLGLPVTDKVTGFSGVVESISFDLYGCVQAVVKPPIKEDGDTRDGRWFDVSRLAVKSEKPVMRLPNFEYGLQAEGKQGAA
ncbi:MAG: hypothetical protein GQ578_08820 [Desulfuromonadaceae bacterium]|nr:hypothetical protein [Desulfuromonadaceae bacterium]